MGSNVLLLQVGSAALGLFGYLILSRGFGTATQVSAGEGLAMLSIAVVFAWWMSPLAAAVSGVRGAYLALVVIDLIWIVFTQGLAGLAFCALPLCPDFAPWLDVVRYGSVIVGGAAAWTAWRAYRALPGPTQWAPAITAVVLIVISFALQGTNAKFP